MSKSAVTKIQLERSVLEALKRVKTNHRENYPETILNLIKNTDETIESETFTQKAQEERIKKLWEVGGHSKWEREVRVDV